MVETVVSMFTIRITEIKITCIFVCVQRVAIALSFQRNK
jgi:hypothetical protein